MEIAKHKKPSGLSINDIKNMRRKIFTRKKSKLEYLKRVDVAMDDNLPIGILHFGDMHLDSDGVDLDLIDGHMDILRRTEGLYGGNLGDTTNNWIGFLGRLYGEQHATVEEAQLLIKNYLKGSKWLYTIIGNHDKWNGGEAIVRNEIKTGVVGEDLRLSLNFPNETSTTLHARHNFTGNSMYNPAHGSVKEALFGSRDDIVIHGHKHSTGYSIITDAERHKILHCIAVGSYKEIDSFKTTMGFRDDNISPSCVTIIDPRLPNEHPDRIKVFFDVYQGAEYLNFLRK